MRFPLSIPLLFLLSAPVIGAEITQTTITNTKIQASDWNLTQEDIVKYRRIMQGPRGNWSPGIDPVLALGSDPDVTAEERDRLADIYVQMDSKRVQAEIAFQKAIDRAWKRNFPGMNRLDIFPKERREPSLIAPDRHAIVIDMDCCSDILAAYMTKINTTKAISVVDVYVKGTEGDNEILKDFVSREGIAGFIQRERMTINHCDDCEHYDIPTKLIEKDGTWLLLE